jgi:hypothetical protein
MSDEKPPFGKSWNTLYLLLVAALIACILSFYFISRYFS